MSEIILPRDPDTLGFIIFGFREALKTGRERSGQAARHAAWQLA